LLILLRTNTPAYFVAASVMKEMFDHLMLHLLSGVVEVVRVGLVHAASEHEVVPQEDAILVGQLVKIVRLVNST
jgi:hypothetical protein